MARPTKLTEEVHRAIVDVVAQGTPITVAAEMNGVRRETIWDWCRRGDESDEEPYATFSHDLRRARARAEAQVLAEIRDASYVTKDGREMPDWRSRAWYAQNVLGYASKQEVAVEVANDVAIDGADAAKELAVSAGLRLVSGGER